VLNTIILMYVSRIVEGFGIDLLYSPV
jgi:hypothetical protein